MSHQPPRPEPEPGSEAAHDDIVPRLRLWSNDTCPFAQSVRIALRELNLLGQAELLVEEVTVDVVGDKDPRFVELWNEICPGMPHRRPAIPVLQHWHSAGAKPVQLVESAVIVQYLMDVFGNGDNNALATAHSRLFIKIYDAELSPCWHLILNSTTADQLYVAAEQLTRGLQAIEGFLMTHGSGHSDWLGEAFGMAEVLLAPSVQRLLRVVPKFRPQVDLPAQMSHVPRFSRWAAAMLGRTSVVETFQFETVVALRKRSVPTWRGGGGT